MSLKTYNRKKSREHMAPECDHVKDLTAWKFMPDDVLEHISQYLQHDDLVQARLACRSWRIPFAKSLGHIVFHLGHSSVPAKSHIQRAKVVFPRYSSSTVHFQHMPSADQASYISTTLQAIQTKRLQHLVVNLPLVRAPVAGVFGQLTALHSLSISRVRPDDQVDLQLIPQLTQLTLNGNLSFSIVMNVAGLTQLKHLTLQGTAVSEHCAWLYCAAINRMSNLTSLIRLQLDGPLFTASSTVDCTAAVASLTTLNHLQLLLLNCKAAPQQQCIWDGRLQHYTCLTDLALDMEALSFQLWSDLNSLNNLRHLTVTTQSSDIIHEVALHNLESLNLKRVSLDSFGLVTHLHKLSELQLDLVAHDAAVRHNVSQLSVLTGLVCLELANSSTDQHLLLTDGRMQALCKGCNLLQTFIFQGLAQISDAGVACFADLMHLTGLSLCNEFDRPTLKLQLLPSTIKSLSLCAVLVIPPLPAAACSAAIASHHITFTAHKPQPINQKDRPDAVAAKSTAAADPSAAFMTSSSPIMFPDCKVLHLDFCQCSNLDRVLQCFRLEDLRVQLQAMSAADAMAIAQHKGVRVLQVASYSGAIDDYAVAQMLSNRHPHLFHLSLRLPNTTLSPSHICMLSKITLLRSLFMDIKPPSTASLMCHLSHLACLSQLTLGQCYGRNCSNFPTILPVLRDFQRALPTCRVSQACST